MNIIDVLYILDEVFLLHMEEFLNERIFLERDILDFQELGVDNHLYT